MSPARSLRIGTRASALALWQAEHVAELIRVQPGAPAVELVRISTQGDIRSDVPLWQTAGRSFFTREIDRALLAGDVDVAVHSLKDLSTQLEPGVALAATLPRADPRDVLVSRSGRALAALPRGARIGTSSLRRRAFLARARKDAVPVELRGNVPTRLERLERGECDAIVLAAAGLARLGLLERVSEFLDPASFPPAVSQGVIGVCTRAQDLTTQRWIGVLDDQEARLASSAERALLRRLEGGCQVPLGALATVHGNVLDLSASVCALDGSELLSVRGVTVATTGGAPRPMEAVALGERLAEELLDRGAGALIASEREARTVDEP
ncbi:MAG TPA: hydroxymethylbilane synthase [Steroidobacteraceae bacterium]|nr:hydroxymethylbilane synthase [Steroidobacteraceae bacterium]